MTTQFSPGKGLDKNTRFHEISYSRLGGYGDERLAKQLFLDLKVKGLAKDSEDGVSIPMHPMVRSLVLVLLSQILRPYGKKLGAELSPATDRPDVIEALQELLSLPWCLRLRITAPRLVETICFLGPVAISAWCSSQKALVRSVTC